ncbi:MAG TPA: DUF4332 domain-containing protein [Gemmatimonadales bacterium]|nr:DUF4332 domain-containing protein [Gemmatimonadales bacterium]
MNEFAEIEGIGDAGIAGGVADLLEAAGVGTVADLARRNTLNLHARMITMNAKQRFVAPTPTLAQVHAWIESARRRERR